MTSADGATILALNSGSSSLKFGLYRVGRAPPAMLFSGEADLARDGRGRFEVDDPHGAPLLREAAAFPDQHQAIVRLGKFLTDRKMPVPAAIGHRVVHGGPQLRRHCLIDEAVLDKLEAATAFAPLHIPPALAVIRFVQEHFAGLPQAACFDTAFHADLPDGARVLPIARELQREGIERYGFHGLSCESIVRQLGSDRPPRLIIAHLGNGASLTAVKDGQSVDTSMGLTPSGGVIMGTRSGDLDPGVLAWLVREKKADGAALEKLVNHQSGLLGISGISGDMRRLHEAAHTHATNTQAAHAQADARLAIDMFCASVAKQVAAMITVLDGVDMIVFTGGIGMNDAAARAAICRRLSWMGIRLDEARNNDRSDAIGHAASRCAVRVLPPQEEVQIARHTWDLIS
ncbi:acetate/propionate family kinase [soil metagenome]